MVKLDEANGWLRNHRRGPGPRWWKGMRTCCWWPMAVSHQSTSCPFFPSSHCHLSSWITKKKIKWKFPFNLLKLAGGEGLLMFVVVAPAAARRLRDRTCGMRGMRWGAGWRSGRPWRWNGPRLVFAEGMDVNDHEQSSTPDVQSSSGISSLYLPSGSHGGSGTVPVPSSKSGGTRSRCLHPNLSPDVWPATERDSKRRLC